MSGCVCVSPIQGNTPCRINAWDAQPCFQQKDGGALRGCTNTPPALLPACPPSPSPSPVLTSVQGWGFDGRTRMVGRPSSYPHWVALGPLAPQAGFFQGSARDAPLSKTEWMNVESLLPAALAPSWRRRMPCPGRRGRSPALERERKSHPVWPDPSKSWAEGGAESSITRDAWELHLLT